jgi:hypothetical protein
MTSGLGKGGGWFQILGLVKGLCHMPWSIAWIFPLYFQLHYLPEERCFQQVGSSAVEGTKLDWHLQPVPISKK